MGVRQRAELRDFSQPASLWFRGLQLVKGRESEPLKDCLTALCGLPADEMLFPLPAHWDHKL